MDTEKIPVNNRAKAARRKLWQVEAGYHCSIIGACLSRKDLRCLAQKRSFEIAGDAGDFDIHQYLSSLSKARSAQSRSLQKLLDQKYQHAVKRYGACRDDDAIRKQWDDDLKAGRIAGAYWAIMTCGVCSSRLLDRVYGDCHMVSFEPFASQVKGNKELQNMRTKIVRLQDSVREQKEECENERQQRRQLQQELEDERVERQRLGKVNIELVGENSLLQGNVSEDLSADFNRLQAEFEQLKEQEGKLKAENVRLVAELQHIKKQVDASRKDSEEQLAAVQHLVDENRSLKQELAYIEKVLRNDEECATPCAACADQSTEQCQGPDLCGKIILYVGGRHGMIARYREMVEKRGGVFLHHDGGREHSRQILPKMLSGADAVLCPIDCVSHDACNRVKKVCKKYQKPFVMMRSSGLSSLARGLGMIHA